MSELNYEEMIKELNEKYDELRKGKETIEEQVRKFKEETDRRTNEFLKQISDLKSQLEKAQEKKITSSDSLDVDSIIAEYSNKKVKTEEEIAREHNEIMEEIENNYRARKETNSSRNIANSIKNFLTEEALEVEPTEVVEESAEEVLDNDDIEEQVKNVTSKAKDVLNKLVDSAKNFLFEAEENINNAVESLNDVEKLDVEPEISSNNDQTPQEQVPVGEETKPDYNSLWNQTKAEIANKDTANSEPIEEEAENIADVLEVGDNSVAYDPDKVNADNEAIEPLVVNSSDQTAVEILDSLPKLEKTKEPEIEAIPNYELKKLETIEDYRKELLEQKKLKEAYFVLKSHEKKGSKIYTHFNYYIAQIQANIDQCENKIKELEEAEKAKKEKLNETVKELITDTTPTNVDEIDADEENTEDIASDVADDLGIRKGNDESYVAEEIDAEEIDKDANVVATKDEITDVLESYNSRLNKMVKTFESLKAINKDKIRIENELSKRVDDAERAKKNVKDFEADSMLLATYKDSVNNLNNKITNLITRMLSITNNDEKQNEFNELHKEFYDLDNEIEKYLQTILKNSEKELIVVNNRIKALKKDKKNPKNKAELAFLKDKKKALKKEIRVINLYSSNNLVLKRVVSGLLGASILVTSLVSLASCARNAHKDRDELDDIITTTTYDDDMYTTSLDVEIPEITTLYTTIPEVTTVSEATTAPTTIETTTTKVETKAPETTKATTTKATTTKVTTTTKETTKKVTTTTEDTEYIDVEEVNDSLESYNNYNNAYRNEYTMVTNHYGVNNEYAIELVNRAYNIQDAGFYMNTSIDELVLLLIRVDNGELMVFDSQGINDKFNEVCKNYLTGTTNTNDIRAIKALPYFVGSNSTTREWLIDYSNILVNILNNPYDDSYKMQGINYLYSLNDYINGMYFGGRYVTQEEYIAATNFYTVYQTFVVPTGTLLCGQDPTVASAYTEIDNTLKGSFQNVYDIVCGDTVVIVSPTEGHYIEEETVYVR